jgi:hypothetical protein
MILYLMSLLRWLLVVIEQFQHKKLKRSRQLGRIVEKMVVMLIFLGQIHIQMGIFFHGLQYFFYTSDVNIIMAVVSINVIAAAVITSDITYLFNTNFLIGSQVY